MTSPKIQSEVSDKAGRRGRQPAKTENSVGKRIIEALGAQPRSWLAQESRLPESTIGDAIKRGPARSDVALAIARALQVDLGWLLTGEGHRSASISEASRNSGVVREKSVNSDAVEIAEIDLRYGLGATYLDSDVAVETRSFSRAWLRNFTLSPPEELFWARGQGDSMERTIQDNDILLIDRRQNTLLTSDLIWAFAFGQVGMIKRLRPMPDGSVKILSDNAAVPPETAVDGELHIVGRVVAIVKRV